MPEIRLIDAELLAEMPLPDYPADADKAVYGKLLLVAGGRNCPGAALLAATAALRSGCGTVRLAAPASIALSLGIALPELYVLPLPETPAGTLAPEALAQLEQQFEACNAILLGPGIGEHPATEILCRELIAHAPLPMLIDAQALSGLKPLLGEGFPAPRLITPHSGEMGRLCDQEPQVIVKNAAELACQFASEYGLLTVLKGHQTHVARSQASVYLNRAGTRGLGTAGSGDVLAGLIAGLLTQSLAPLAAACWGVHLHALAGEAVAAEIGDDGLMARDLLDRLPMVQRQLRASSSP